MASLFSMLKGLGMGAGAMYFFDPVVGRRRRSLLRDQAVSMAHEAECFIDRGVRDLANRCQGTLAEMRSKMSANGAPSDVVARRVRSVMGRHVSHPTAIEVDVSGDRVILRGPILASEIQPFVRAVESVRGVMHVENHLDPHSQPDVPELMNEPRHHRTPASAWPGNWSPGTQLLIAGAAVGLATACAIRRNSLAAIGAGVAMGLIAREAVDKAASTSESREAPTSPEHSRWQQEPAGTRA